MGSKTIQVFLVLVFGVILLSAQGQAETPRCVQRFTRLVKGLGFSKPLRVGTSQEVRDLVERPEVVFLVRPKVHQFSEFSDLGYIRDFFPRKESEIRWVRNNDLLSDREVSVTPARVQHHREEFIAKFGEPSGVLRANFREKFFSELPEADYLLTARTLNQIPPGRYAFVVLEGENFLRLGVGHHRLGAQAPASSAGEVVIQKNPEGAGMIVSEINPRSDTYRPMRSDLLPALEALWRQGVWPEQLKIIDWDQKTLLLELK